MMSLWTCSALTRLNRLNVIIFPVNSVRTGAWFHNICGPVVLYKYRSPCVSSGSPSNILCSSLPRTRNGTRMLLPNDWYRVQSVAHKSSFQGDKREKIQPDNEEMNLRHSVENDYLSWMRNTYMMTLAGLTILNTASLTDNWIISQVVFFTAFLNLSVGTAGYLHSLSSLRKRKVMKSVSSVSCQLAAIFHMFLWMSVLFLIISPERREANEGEEIIENIQDKYK